MTNYPPGQMKRAAMLARQLIEQSTGALALFHPLARGDGTMPSVRDGGKVAQGRSPAELEADIVETLAELSEVIAEASYSVGKPEGVVGEATWPIACRETSMPTRDLPCGFIEPTHRWHIRATVTGDSWRTSCLGRNAVSSCFALTMMLVGTIAT